MILLFDTSCGLCNQLLDIQCAIHFCVKHNIEFSFRYCSFRNKDDLRLFFNKPFHKLFDDKLLVLLYMVAFEIYYFYKSMLKCYRIQHHNQMINHTQTSKIEGPLMDKKVVFKILKVTSTPRLLSVAGAPMDIMTRCENGGNDKVPGNGLL